MWVFLIVTISLIGLAQGKCPGKQSRQCGPVEQCKRTCNNIKLLTIKPLCDTTPCVEGCFCPPSAPIETWNSNFNMKCIPSVVNCSCPKGQTFKKCSDVVSPTCNSPVVHNPTDQCGFPRCQCAKSTPIWHQGKCITSDRCICPNSCAKAGCSMCNKCTCKAGKSRNCDTKKCPDIMTPGGLQQILKQGCWRISPSGEQCIFYSPCQDTLGEISCDSNVAPRKKFCSKCHQCQCTEEGEEICSRDNNCEHLIRSKGCWALIKSECVFVSPCPNSSAKVCQGLKPGIKMCDMCSKCECVFGNKICSGSQICPDPKKHGCYITRKYMTEERRCYFVSPCPNNVSPIQLPCSDFDVTTNFCYMLNHREDVCEFVSPCPLISTCSNKDSVCNKCNECTCTDGQIQCKDQRCGNPIPDGCWVLRGQTCVFLSPCPNDVVLDADQFCNTGDTGAIFCRRCNICDCTPEGFALCTQKVCPQITEDMGCYLSMHGTCVFMAPCPQVL